MENVIDLWKNLHKRIINRRKRIFSLVSDPSFKKNWLNKRIKTNMWSIDEILRHMLASEVFYVHSKFGVERMPKGWGVGAQWVGDSNFGLKEGSHFNIEKIQEISLKVEAQTDKFINEFTDDLLNDIIDAPWGEKMTFKEILNHWYEHEMNHAGQVQLLITFFSQKSPN